MAADDLLRQILGGLKNAGIDYLLGDGVSAGIDASKLARRTVATIEAVGRDLSESLAGVASLIGVQTATLSAELATLRESGSRIETMLANPRSTAAVEHYRRGLRAIARGWSTEAITDLERAVDADPYLVDAQAMLGVALVGAGDADGGVARLALAVRYGIDEDPALAVGAGLMAARIDLDRGRADDALRMLGMLERYESVAPEVTALRALVTGSVTGLAAALRAAPELAAVVVASDHEPPIEVARLVYDDPAGPAWLADEVLGRATALVDRLLLIGRAAFRANRMWTVDVAGLERTKAELGWVAELPRSLFVVGIRLGVVRRALPALTRGAAEVAAVPSVAAAEAALDVAGLSDRRAQEELTRTTRTLTRLRLDFAGDVSESARGRLATTEEGWKTALQRRAQAQESLDDAILAHAFAQFVAEQRVEVADDVELLEAWDSSRPPRLAVWTG